MEILDALQDIRTRNARNERVDESQVMEELRKERERKEALLKESDPEEIERKRALEEDEKLVRRYFNKMQDIEVEEEIEGEMPSPTVVGSSSNSQASGSQIVKRARPLDEEEELNKAESSRNGQDKEPDLKSLLSESARAQLLMKNGNGNGSTLAPVAKKKKGKSAFGIVKKKA